MKLIRKPKRPPTKLTEYLAEPLGTNYESAPKQAIRDALAREQGHLCAYCMGRIEPSERSMKIDHLAPQKPPSGPGGFGSREPSGYFAAFLAAVYLPAFLAAFFLAAFLAGAFLAAFFLPAFLAAFSRTLVGKYPLERILAIASSEETASISSLTS